MPEQQVGQEIPETGQNYGKHDRVITGYLPRLAGDQKITVDVDSPLAAEVVAELPTDWKEQREKHVAEQPKRLAEAQRREREQSSGETQPKSRKR